MTEKEPQFHYAGPLFVGFAFTGNKLYCPVCAMEMERNSIHKEWFRCRKCLLSYNVLTKLPPDHPIFQKPEPEGE